MSLYLVTNTVSKMSLLKLEVLYGVKVSLYYVTPIGSKKALLKLEGL